MVNFSVFNELSLPFETQYDVNSEFVIFFKILNKLEEKNLNKMRVSKNFKEYEIVKNVYFQEFVGQLRNQTLQDRIREFLANQIIKIETPLIKDEEFDEVEEQFIQNYFYDGQSTLGGLACSYIWNTIAVSFNSDEKWCTSNVEMMKNDEIIIIKNISLLEHIDDCVEFFKELEEETKLNITKENFWEKKEEFFTKIEFTKEVESQIKTLDSKVFKKAVSVLRDLETKRKLLSDLDISNEGETVRTNKKLRGMREFYIEENKYFFEKHLKGFANGYRMYILEKDEKIYIGYIGKHLPSKKF